MNQPTAVSLFAGVGGFDLAAHNVGINVVAAVEIDAHARGVLAHQFPTTKLFDDVRTVTADDLLAAGFIPDGGFIFGGFPCQDLSIAGKRAGLDGGRSGLYWEIIRLAEKLQPSHLLLENVPGLLSSNNGRDMGTVVGALADIGYRIGWRVLDAQHYGVPQRRRRVFIFATHLGTDTIAEILFERESGTRNPTQSQQTRQNPAGTTTNSTTDSGAAVGKFKLYDFPNTAIAPTLSAQRAKDTLTWKNDAPVLMRQREGKPGGGKGPLMSEDLSLTIATNNDQILFTEIEVEPIIGFQPTDGKFAKFNDDGNSVTIKASDAPAIATATIVRRLTPTECERLQGFPDGWTAQRIDHKTGQLVEQKDSARYKQMGNAVAVPCVQWLLQRIIETTAKGKQQ